MSRRTLIRIATRSEVAGMGSGGGTARLVDVDGVLSGGSPMDDDGGEAREIGPRGAEAVASWLLKEFMDRPFILSVVPSDLTAEEIEYCSSAMLAFNMDVTVTNLMSAKLTDEVVSRLADHPGCNQALQTLRDHAGSSAHALRQALDDEDFDSVVEVLGGYSW